MMNSAVVSYRMIIRRTKWEWGGPACKLGRAGLFIYIF